MLLQSCQAGLGMVVHPFHLSTLEAEAGGFLLKGSKFQASRGCTHKMNCQRLKNKYDNVRLLRVKVGA